MAEPLKKDPYDKKFGEEDSEPVTKPDLKSIEGGGQTTEPKKGHLKAVDSDKLEKAEQAGGEDSGVSDAESNERTKLQESEGQVGAGYRHEDNSRLGGFKSLFRGRRRKMFIGGGLVGALIAAMIALFLTFLPLKILHIVNNLQTRFFSTSENAVERRSEKLMADYLQRYVMPSLGDKCPSTRVDRSCINKGIPGETPAGKLFRGWKDANLDNNLANKYGIEITRGNFNGSDGNYQYRLSIDGGKSGVNLDGFLNNQQGLFEAIGDRQDIRAKFKEAFANETRWKRVMYRFKVGRLLERKYGIRRCVFFCKLKDKFDDWKDNKKKGAKAKIVQRVIDPHNEILKVAITCIFDPDSDCGTNAGADDDGARQTKFEKEVQKLLQKAGVEATQKAVKDVVKAIEKYNNKSFSRYIISEILERVTNKTIAKAVDKGIPIVGWINTAATVVNKLHDSGPTLKRFVYITNAAAYVNLYILYRSNADELKNGKVDASLVGSLVDTLGDQNERPNGDIKKGQPAEVTPLYSHLLGNTPQTQTSLLDIFSPKAFAANSSIAESKYTCDDNKPIPADKLVCPEESLVTNNFITQISDAFSKSPLSALSDIAAFWRSSFGQILGFLAKGLNVLIENFPGYSEAAEAMNGILQPFLEKIVEFLIPSPISPDMSGGRGFVGAAGGADVAGSDYAQYGTGAARISDKQVAEIRSQQEVDTRQQFVSKSFFARMFDGSDPHSMVSQVALSLPIGKQSQIAQSSFAGLLTSPFSKIASGFSALFRHRPVFAAAEADPFGVPQYGYPTDSTIIDENPDIYTETYCKKMNDDWTNETGDFENTIVIDEATGMEVHTKANPCKLEEAATGAAGGYFTDDVLTKADLTDPGQKTTSSNPNPQGSASSCTLPRDKMVEQILGHQGDGSLRFQNPGPQISDIQNSAKTTDKLICMFWSVLEQGHFKLSIGAINSDHHPGTLHGQGRAIDFGSAGTSDMPGLFKWLYDNRSTLQIDELIHQPVPPGSELLDHGKDCPGTQCYDQGTLNAHYNHVHAGVLP